jgi:nicotinamidase-related amidase
MLYYFNSLVQLIVRNIISVIECFRANKKKILFTRHCHRYCKTDGGMLGTWRGDLILHGSAEWELIEGLLLQSVDTIIDMRVKIWCGAPTG